MNKKGQPRKGGMPLGWKKPEGVRKQHQLRAYDDEWQLIQKFAKIVKKGDRPKAELFLNQFDI